MALHCNPTTTFCAAALILGLAACGGGGGGGPSPMTDALDAMVTERAVALAETLEAARTTGADGAFDDTRHMVAPSVVAMHDGTAAIVDVTETGTPRGGTARGGEFAELENAPRPIAGWTGARFGRGDAKERLVVYADVGAPEPLPFSPENLNRLREVSGLTGETVPASGLTIVPAWLPVIRSTSLAPADERGSVTYGTTGSGADEGRVFAGTFAGAAGMYGCSGSACSVTLDDRSAPAAMGGTWTFVPDSGATVKIPDYEVLHLGWWLEAGADGAPGFQTFAGATGFPQGSGNVTAAMEGLATYAGAAAGVYATVDSSGGRITSAHSGEFTAEATLRAHFFGAQDAGSVTGEIGSFQDEAGRPLEGWRVILNAAPLTAGEAAFAGEAEGMVGTGTSGEGSWEGRFHGTDGAETNARPSHATGRFDLHFPGAHLAGAFGAEKR